MVAASDATPTTATEAYQPLRPSRSQYLQVRGLNYHVREWGPAEAEPVVLLHGARDSSASFQFLVDAMPADRRFIAPDWRGHGQTDWANGAYWQTDFLCDLDVLLATLLPDQSVRMVAHSMGAGISYLYAGLRPKRVSRLVALDSLGNRVDSSPVRIVPMLTGLLNARTDKTPRPYATLEEMAVRLAQTNRRLSPAQALFLTTANAKTMADGRFFWPHDPGFLRSLVSLHTDEEWVSIWERIEASVLLLLSSDPRPEYATSNPDLAHARAQNFRDIVVQWIPDTGHNLHHDAPDYLARKLDAFLFEPH